ncbi:SMR family transporter [Desulfobotulus sp. H1]|uniref:SMR family transporter n=1 Tax=Desulfobotulus pelophilus TaxID=2823377 RepID=A0ABT3N573_9BACT|nr:SMR family transporter [Desulfobotulus pelophilus]
MNKSWVYVGLTCLFELFWVYGFNVASSWWHWVIIVGIILVDFHFLSKACEKLPTGTVYAVFAAVGTAGTALMDVVLFAADFHLQKGLFIVLIIIGVVSLKLADNQDEGEVG